MPVMKKVEAIALVSSLWTKYLFFKVKSSGSVLAKLCNPGRLDKTEMSTSRLYMFQLMFRNVQFLNLPYE